MSGREATSETTELGGETLRYHRCRVLPDTALVLRDAVREAERLWKRELGVERYEELRATPEGDEFFTGRVRMETVPPDREMLAVWLPFPADFRQRIKPQLVDFVEVP